MEIINNPLRLLVEDQLNDYSVIFEQENPNKPKVYKIKGPYIVTEVKNNNGRCYKKSMMEKCVAEYKKDMIDTGRALGELQHPETCEINPERVCHRVVSLTNEGNSWIGESVILEGTPMGDILRSIILHGGKPGMSTRGVGNVAKDGTVDSYKLVAVDSVLNPSAPGAFVNGILESKQYMIDTYGAIVELPYRALEANLDVLPRHDKEKYVIECFNQFFNSIKNN